VESVLLGRPNKNTKERKMQNNYVYTKSGTDITIRWAKLYNYVPASEQEFYKKKWADFRAICNQSIEDIVPEVKTSSVVYKWKKK
jgi:hypothetical protein